MPAILEGVLAQSFQCAICLEVASGPLTTNCGHIFCGQCVHGQTDCPTCRQPITSMQTNTFLNRTINSLPVRCSDCEWRGENGMYKSHGCVPKLQEKIRQLEFELDQKHRRLSATTVVYSRVLQHHALDAEKTSEARSNCLSLAQGKGRGHP